METFHELIAMHSHCCRVWPLHSPRQCARLGSKRSRSRSIVPWHRLPHEQETPGLGRLPAADHLLNTKTAESLWARVWRALPAELGRVITITMSPRAVWEQQKIILSANDKTWRGTTHRTLSSGQSREPFLHFTLKYLKCIINEQQAVPRPKGASDLTFNKAIGAGRVFTNCHITHEAVYWFKKTKLNVKTCNDSREYFRNEGVSIKKKKVKFLLRSRNK